MNEIDANQKDPIIGYDIDGNPQIASTLKVELKKEIETAKRGEGITVEELQKKSEEWLVAKN